MESGWREISFRCLEAAEVLLERGYPSQAIEMAWLSMSCAVRRLLVPLGLEGAGDSELPGLYASEVLPRLSVSPENRRAYLIVCQLRERVFTRGVEEGDPVTARACLDDARRFLLELAEADLPPGDAEAGEGASDIGHGRGSPGHTASRDRLSDIGLDQLAALLLRLEEGGENRG